MDTGATSGTKIKKSKKQIKRKHSGVFERINYNAGGIDAGAEEHYVAVPEDRAIPWARKFSTTTEILLRLTPTLSSQVS